MSGSPAVALLLSTSYFEDFYGSRLGIDVDEYVDRYRNDWSWDYCEMLASQGLRPHLYVPTTGEGRAYRTPEGYGVRLLPLGRAYAPWLRVPALERTPWGRYVAQLVNTGSFLRPLRAALAADAAEVLMVQEYWTARYDLLAARLRLPLIAVDQGLPSVRELKIFKGSSLPSARAVIVQTEAEAERIRGWGGTALRIPNGVDAEFFTPGPAPDGPPSVLSVTRLENRQKRVSDLVRAFAKLPSEWRLDIVGTGPARNEILDLAVELGVGDRVALHGFVIERERIRALLRGCSVFALPSAYEGLPVSLLEAMSCGAPPVVSRIPAMQGVVQHDVNGLLVSVGSPPELAEALQRARVERARLSQAARASIEADYAMPSVGSRLAELVRRSIS